MIRMPAASFMFVSTAIVLTVVLALLPGKADAQSAEPKLVAQFGVWGAYTASPGGKKVCFALAKPSSSKTNPPNRSRDPGYLFISTRPAEGVKEEVSVNYGYPVKGEGDLEIGTSHFALHTQGEGGWVKNAAEEAGLVEMMRKGAQVTVKGTSTRGTETTDVYSLQGISQALDRAAKECK